MVSIAPGTENIRDLAVDPAGKVLVGGYVAAPDYPDESDVFVLRLDAAGKPDATFGGGDGIVTIDRTNHDRGGSLGLAGSRILVGASLDSGGNWGNQWTVFGLTGSGALDPTFSGDGLAAVPSAQVGTFDGLRDLAVQPDGKIVLGGTTAGQLVATARLSAGGVLDPTYDGDGVATTLVENGGEGYRLLVQSDKKIILVGYAFTVGRTDSDMAAVRWTGAGKLDTSFGGDGKVIVDSGQRRNERAYGAALAADGKIVLGGYAETSAGMDNALVRLDWDGTLDTSFSGDGIVVTSTTATAIEQLNALSVGAGDRIRAAGENLNGWTLLGYTGRANTGLSVADLSLTEPNAATAGATFTVKLSVPSPQPVTVRYTTVNGTALAPGDYVARSGVLTIPAGATSVSVTVSVVGDTIREASETFRVTLSLPTNAGISDGSATATIVNND